MNFPEGCEHYDLPEGVLGIANNEIAKQITTTTSLAQGFGEYASLRATAMAGLSDVERMQLFRPPFDTNPFKEDVYFRTVCKNSWNATFGHFKPLWLQGYMFDKTKFMYSQESIVKQLANLPKSRDEAPTEYVLKTQRPAHLRDTKRPRDDGKGNT